jgi:hypothetical protein
MGRLTPDQAIESLNRVEDELAGVPAAGEGHPSLIENVRQWRGRVAMSDMSPDAIAPLYEHHAKRHRRTEAIVQVLNAEARTLYRLAGKRSYGSALWFGPEDLD